MKPCLLIVDDEQDIRDMLSRHFRYLDYTVLTAENGIDALRTLASEHIDVVVTDIKMPGMDGIQLLRELRSQYPTIHTIMMTGFVNQENVLTCMRVGADCCVFKPFDDLSELDAAVRRAVEAIERWIATLHGLIELKNKQGVHAI